MLRAAFISATSRVVGGAAVAAAAAPEVAHARAMQPRAVLPGKSKVSLVTASMLLIPASGSWS